MCLLAALRERSVTPTHTTNNEEILMKRFNDKPATILLIEDNPGDVRLIEEMFQNGKELLQAVDVGNSNDGLPEIHHEDRLSDGLEYLKSNDVDIILLDLNLPDSSGLDTLTSMIDATERLPIVVLTGLGDGQIGIDSIQEGAQDYLVKDEVTGDTLVRTIYHAIERNRLENEQRRRQEQLEALNNLNQIAQDITHIVITTSSREELEREICNRLAASDAYLFAWIGEIKRGSDQVTPRVAAGVDDGYLESISITIDGDETGQGPTGKAVRTNEVQVAQHVLTDPDYESWREQAEAYGYRSSAAIPIVYEGIRYGVLNVYAASPNAFSDPEKEIFTRLGDGIGHAIAAIERKEALVSDAVHELEFRVEGLLDELVEFSAEQPGQIQLQNLTSYDDSVRAYGSATRVPEEEFRETVDRAASLDDYRGLPANSDDLTFKFEFVLTTARPLFETVAAHGGRIQSMIIANGELRLIMEFPRGNDTRQMIGLIQDHVSKATLVAQRTIQRSEDPEEDPRSVLTNLTEKQRKALKTAYISGYFNWPRTNNASEIAERLGISSATFTQHLRTAERKFFNAIFEESVVDESDADLKASPDG